MVFDWMVTGGFLPFNPADSVRGPKYVVRKGKTPVLTPEEARLLLDSIPLTRTVKLEGDKKKEVPCSERWSTASRACRLLSA